MKRVMFIFALSLLISCGQEKQKDSNNEQQVVSTENTDILESKTEGTALIGTFEFIYPNNTEDLIENHYIVINKVDGKYVGFYYGTSDEFDDAREGYYPGFFVAKMENLVLTSDSIMFTLNVPNEKILSKAVDLDIKSYEEAKEKGYENWPNEMQLKPKDYKGVILDQNTIFFKGEYEFMDKKFIRKK